MIFHISIESFNDLHKNSLDLLKKANEVYVYECITDKKYVHEKVYTYNKIEDKLEFWKQTSYRKENNSLKPDHGRYTINN